MIRISYWAKTHIWQSRIIIVISYIFLNILGIFTGNLLHEVNVIIPEIVLSGFIGLGILLFYFYPEKLKTNYYKRKLFDYVLGLTTLFFIIFIGNHNNTPFDFSTKVFASNFIVPRDSTSINDNEHLKSFREKLHSLDVSKLTKREKIKIIKDQVKEIKKDEQLTNTEKVLLILLSLLMAQIVLGVIVFLSCSLLCSGSEALALILAFGGVFFTIFFLVRTIIRILKGPRQRKRQRLKDAAKSEVNKDAIKEN